MKDPERIFFDYFHLGFMIEDKDFPFVRYCDDIFQTSDYVLTHISVFDMCFVDDVTVEKFNVVNLC